jgi:hypothetical protein
MSFWRLDHPVQWHGIATASTSHLHSATADNVLQCLLDEFADVFATPTSLPPSQPVDHRIHLLLGTDPIVVQPYRYPQLLKDEIEHQCSAMLAQGLIYPSTSPFSASVLLVKKKDGTWQFCVDYRALNAKTVKDKFPIPVVEELLDELNGACYFTKLDLRSGYHQVRMHPEDVAKTVFRTHHGHFEFMVMAFGLTNAPPMFQALMNGVLHDYLHWFVLVFFDDILIYSSSWSEHLQHVRVVLTTLRKHQLAVKQSKCVFGSWSVAYLGHVISASGVAMDPTKVEAVQAWPTPRTPQALRGFLGLAGYYRKFIRNYGIIAGPLTQLLKKEAFVWSPEATAAFTTLKQVLTTAPVLQLPNFDKPFIINCDTSGTGFGAVLHQEARPIAFYSRPVAPQHSKLATYERELIGLVKVVRHWRPYLWSRSFIVRTDHYALKFLLDQCLSTIPQHTWVSKLFEYDFIVEFNPGRMNTVADALSWCKEDQASVLFLSTPTFQFFDDFRKEAASHPDVIKIKQQIEQGTALPVWSIVDDLVLYKGHIFVPSSSEFWPQILLLRTARDMKGLKRCFSCCVTHSSILMQHVGFAILSKVAAHVNATNLNIFTHSGCYNLWRFLVRFGLILQWTLLKVFQNQEANQ